MVDDITAGTAVGADDLICDFLNCEVVGAEEDVEESVGVGGVGNNFSVGYLIGGGGSGVVGRDGSGPGEELHALPASDCLSLAPIVTTAFEEPSTAVGGSTGVNGVSAFQPFWTTSCSSAESSGCTTNAPSGIVHEEYEDFERRGNDM